MENFEFNSNAKYGPKEANQEQQKDWKNLFTQTIGGTSQFSLRRDGKSRAAQKIADFGKTKYSKTFLQATQAKPRAMEQETGQEKF